MSRNTTTEGAEHNITSSTDELNNMHITCTEITAAEDVVDLCANCGKEGNDLNICNKCQMAQYCNAVCKKKHRSKHKKKCERRVAELHDEALFKQPPLKEDCPICFIPLPWLGKGSKYKTCCGKDICSGCIHAVALRDKGVGLCPFCRTPIHTSHEEVIERVKKRVDVGDANAMYILGSCYSEGSFGLAQDHNKALELWHKAGELGDAEAYHNIGNVYYNGQGVERDNKKANHYYELAAMGGVVKARLALGLFEDQAGNMDRALKHYMVAAGTGHNDSVKMIQLLYKAGHATKEDYTSALRAYQKCIDEIRSEQRDIAAAFSEEFKYY